MDNMIKELPEKIIFFSDAHLGLYFENNNRIDIVASFLSSLQNNISHLYINGDLFDFWFEYKSVIPAAAPKVIFELYNLAKCGTSITILAGNHDYWYGDYFRKNIGVNFVSDHLEIFQQGKKIFLHHGDGLYPHDHGYRLLKKILRNKISISLFSFIHPDLAYKIAKLSSSTSRNYLAPPPSDNERYISIFREIADRKLSEGYDAVIYGHSHIPLMEDRSNGKLILLGDWMKYFSYAVLENGEFSFKYWKS